MGAKLINPEIGTIIWTVITFVILAALLGRFAWKPLIQTLEERENTIKDALDKTERSRAEAEETLRKNKEILSNARRDTAAIIEQGRRESETMRAELLTRARKEAQELVDQGKRQIQHEQKLAIEKLRGQVADLAIRGAEHLISRSLDDAKHRELVSDYVRGLPSLGAEESDRG